MEELVRLGIVAAIVGLSAVVGAWWRRRDGRVHPFEDHSRGRFEPHQLARLGLTGEGADALGVLLGSPTCAPCIQVKQVLSDLRDSRSGFDWVYVDAGDHLDLARDHHVLRVPTLFVLDPDGRILARTSGVPALRDLERVLDREGDLTSA